MIDTVFNLIWDCSSSLAEDAVKLIQGLPNDNEVFKIMKESIQVSSEKKKPICQDTGYPYFKVSLPYEKAVLIPKIKEAVSKALVKATQQGVLRPNSVNPISNKNYGNNLGTALPYIDWNWSEEKDISISLLLKGGGSENVSAQYSLPFEASGAGRDQKGIINTVLYHLQQIQGKGCSPGVLGIAIGGDRASSAKLAKAQLFRSLEDENSDKDLAFIEKEILKRANLLDIGAMGLGGNPTLLAVKAAQASRHPASFFVSISYLCWVIRRKTCILPTI